MNRYTREIQKLAYGYAVLHEAFENKNNLAKTAAVGAGVGLGAGIAGGALAQNQQVKDFASNVSKRVKGLFSPSQGAKPAPNAPAQAPAPAQDVPQAQTQTQAPTPVQDVPQARPTIPSNIPQDVQQGVPQASPTIPPQVPNDVYASGFTSGPV